MARIPLEVISQYLPRKIVGGDVVIGASGETYMTKLRIALSVIFRTYARAIFTEGNFSC